MINFTIAVIAALTGVHYGITKVLKVSGMIMEVDLGRHQDISGLYQYKIRITISDNNNHYELFILDKPQILVKLISKVLFKHKIE